MVMKLSREVPTKSGKKLKMEEYVACKIGMFLENVNQLPTLKIPQYLVRHRYLFGELQDPVCSTLLFCQNFTIPANIFLAPA